MRLQTRGSFVRAALAAAAASTAAVSNTKPYAALAADNTGGVPTFSLKSLPAALAGADKPAPGDQLGVLGRGANNQKSGRLQFCPTDKDGCISTFSLPDESSYVPPWTYEPNALEATSSFEARKRALLAADEAANGGAEARPLKSLEVAQAELEAVLQAYGPACTLVKSEPRYVYAEFREGGAVDDVEFLFSLDAPIVGYRSSSRGGGGGTRNRERIRSLRKSLSASGWKSVGRIVG